MKDPLELLEETYRHVEPEPCWEDRLRKKLKGRFAAIGWSVAAPLAAAALTYGFLIICQGAPSQSSGVPREVLERQMAHSEPAPIKPNVSGFRSHWS